MATKILYFLNTTAATPNWFGSMQDGGSAPTTALSTAGWTVAKNSPPLYFRGRWGATGLATVSQTTSYIASTSGPAKGTGSGTTTSGDSFITPAAYRGTFAAGAWALTLGLRPTTATPVGTLRMRVWASVNADGTSARELTSGALAGSTVTMSSTTTTYTPTLTWSPAAITLNNEFMFFQIEWQETTAGGSNSTGLGLYLGATCAITTTDFLPTITGTFASTEVADTAATSGLVGLLGTAAATEAGDTAAGAGTVTNAKHLYVLATTAAAPNYWGNLQEGGSPPTSANSNYGFLPSATPLSAPFYQGMLGATAPNPTGLAASYVDAATRAVPGTSTSAAGDSFTSPTSYGGTFAADAWSFDWNLRATTAGATGQLRLRVWASANADGSSARELTTADAATKLLLHCDGPDGSTSIIDSSGQNHSMTLATGTANLSVAQSKFGNASLYLNGGYLQADGSSDFAFGTGDFTIDFWVNGTVVTNSVVFYDSRPNGGNGVYLTIYYTGTNVNVFTNNVGIIIGTQQFVAGTWYHVAVTRSAGKTKLFINGVQDGPTYTDGNSYLNAPGLFPRIGDGAWGGPLQGYMDEVRVSNIARWTSNFTPPSAPYNLSSTLSSAVVTLSATVDTDASISWSPAAITLNNEYLFFQLEWQETALGSAGSDVLFRAGTAAITTPAFASAPLSGSLAASEAVDASAINAGIIATGTLGVAEAADTASISAKIIATGTLSSTEVGDTAAVAGKVGLLGTFASTEVGDTAAASGALAWFVTLAATEGADTAGISAAVIGAAAKTFYVLATDAVTLNYWGNLQEGGAAPSGANTSYGFLPGTTPTSTPFYQGMLGAAVPNPTALAASYVDAAARPVPGTGTGIGVGGPAPATGTLAATEAGDTVAVSGNVLTMVSNLISFWELQADGTDSVTATGNDLTNHGATFVAGKVGNCGKFTRLTGYFGHADNASLHLDTHDMSISLWAQMDTLFTSVLALITKVGAYSEYAILTSGSPPKFQALIYDGSSQVATTLNANTFGGISTGIWYHVVMTWAFASRALKIYVNTVSDSVTSIATPGSGSTPLNIGNMSAAAIRDVTDPFASNYEWTGFIDQIGFWKDRVLTAADVTALYNGGAGLSYVDMQLGPPFIAGTLAATEAGDTAAASGSVAAAATYSGPVDINGTPVFWGGLRASSAAYTTGAKHLVDLVDQAGANQITIDCMPDGTLDVATLNAWVAAHSVTTIKVKQLYDQSGNSTHGITDSLADMPTLSVSATPYYIRLAPRQANYFIVSVTPTAQPMTFSAVVAKGSSTGWSQFWEDSFNHDIEVGAVVVGDSRLSATCNFGTPFVGSATFVLGATVPIQWLISGSSSFSYVNGSSSVTGNPGSGSFGVGGDSYLSANTLDPFYLTEVGLWATDQSTSFAAMNANQRAFWGLTGLAVIEAGDTAAMSSATPYVGPVDVYGAALGWWGLRACSAAYTTGAKHLIDVTDSTQTHVLTVDCLPDGTLDVASINAWKTANSITTVYVVKFYDQSGNGNTLPGYGNTLPVLTLSSMPYYLALGAAHLGYFNGIFPSHAQPLTFSTIVGQSASTATITYVNSQTGPGLNLGPSSGAIVPSANLGNTLTSTSTFAVGPQAALQLLASTTSSFHCVNGVNDSAVGDIGSNPFNFSPTGNFTIGVGGVDTTRLTECGIWAGDKSSLFATMNTNQHTFWGF